MLIEMDKNQNRNNKANANSVKVSKTNFTKENGMESEGLPVIPTVRHMCFDEIFL